MDACIIVLLTKTGPRCISFRCKFTVSLAQGAVHDAEADVADPVFVRSTIKHHLKSRATAPICRDHEDVILHKVSRLFTNSCALHSLDMSLLYLLFVL